MANLPFDLVSCPWTIRLHGFVAMQLYTITTSVLTAQTIYYGHIYHRLKRNRQCIKVRISIYMYSLLQMKQQFSTIKDVFYWVKDQISCQSQKETNCHEGGFGRQKFVLIIVRQSLASSERLNFLSLCCILFYNLRMPGLV